MFCSNCGAKAEGNFCWKCGTKLDTLPAKAVLAEVVEAELVIDWSHEAVYERLIRVREVRDLIARYAKQAKVRLSGEEFLELAEAIIPTGVPLSKLTKVVQPFYANMGIKTGKESSEHVARPIGQVIAAALCSLAKNGQTLQNVEQLEHGCRLEATLPSDLWALEGKISVRLLRMEGGTLVEAATHIAGQLFDWGKSRRCLDSLLSDLRTQAAAA